MSIEEREENREHEEHGENGVRSELMRANLALTGDQIVSERLAIALTARLGKTAAQEHLRQKRGLAGLLEPADLAVLTDPANYTGASGELVDRALRTDLEPLRSADPDRSH